MGKNHACALSLAALLLAGCAGTAKPAPGTVFSDCAECPEMVVIPAGAFAMGFDGGETPERYDGPVRNVTIAEPFALGRFEVTVAQWRAFIDETGYAMPDWCRVWSYDRKQWARDEDADWRDPKLARPILPEEPAVCLTWKDAQAYVAWLRQKTGKPYRLPSEAEWEYAARAGTSTRFFFGEDANEGCAYGNIYDQTADAVFHFEWEAARCTDGYASLAPVGRFKPNPFGLHDVLGNVWEWLEDCYIVPYPPDPSDGGAVQASGACRYRAVRGGAWMTWPERPRHTWRGRDPEETQVVNYFGLRVARDL
jgi:formylglycine-generating enzyme required for sulfatase activity